MEKQIARLPADVRPVLEAASVCGMEFRTQTVADALGRDALWVGERCDELVRQQHWIGHVALGGLPDGSLGARYAFRHALYRHVFYQRIGALTRAQLHRDVALSMERGRAAGVAVAAAELASHYDLGHDAMAALRHYVDAADAALKQFAQVEAVSLTGQALALLPRCPQEPPRFALELALMLKRGVACSQLHGMSSKEAHAAFERAQALCDLLPETPALGWALNGLGLVRFGAADYGAAHALGVRIHALADRHDDAGLRIAASNLMGLSCASLGEHAKAIEWFELGVAVCEALAEPPPQDRFFVDPGVSMGGHLSVHLPPLGLVDRARAHAERALARARRLAHPMAEAVATRCYCMLEIRLNNPERAASMADRLAQLAADHGIIQADGASRLLGGWAQAHLGDPTGGYARILEGGAILERIGMVAGATQVACYAAEALLTARRWSDAMRHVDEGMQLARRLGERLRIPDFLLLQARAELGQGRVDAARASMRESLSEARAQHAPGFELSALVALCELEEPAVDDLDALERAYARVTEGLDTKLVKRARELIERRNAGQRTS
jgi:tetratricopeptide (TPR) repeat protein